MLWILTREEADNRALAVLASDLRTVSLPCIVRTPLPWPGWTAGGDPAAVMVTSAAAAACVAAAWHELPAPPLLAALDGATRAALGERGLHARVTVGGGVEELAQALREHMRTVPGRWRVLYPTSDVARGRAEHQAALACLTEVAAVEVVAVYSTRPAPALAQRFLALPSAEPFGVVFASPSAVEAWRASVVAAPRRVVCLGRSTLQRWRDSLKDGEPAGVLAERTANHPGLRASGRESLCERLDQVVRAMRAEEKRS